MKIAISSMREDIEGNISETFGRCSHFIIAEIKDNKVAGFEAIVNISANQMGGAGISAAQTVAEQGVEAVITGNLGPRAAEVLSQFNIKAYKASGVTEVALQQFINGELEEIK